MLRPSESILSRSKFAAHPHACIIFDEIRYYRKIASAFIREGLLGNEKCIMAVDQYREEMIAEDLEATGLNLDDLLAEGSLTVIDVKGSYSDSNGFEPDKTIEIWITETKRAIANGYRALRVVGEASFAIGGAHLTDKLIHYENIINEVLFSEFPFKSLCVYDKSLYSQEVIKGVIKAHPILIYNDEVFIENIHYIPPEFHFHNDPDSGEIDLWIANVRRNNQNLKALRESEQKFRRMFDDAPMSYQSLDIAGDILEVNKAWLKTFGYQRYEVIGRNFSEFLRSDQRNEFSTILERFINGEEDISVEFEMLKKDRTPVYVSLTGKKEQEVVADSDRLHCIMENITIRKQAESALRQSEMTYRTLFENMVQGAFYQRADGVLVDCNPALLNLFGISRDQFLGKTSMDPQWKVIREDGSDLPGEQHPSIVALQTGREVRDYVAGVFNPQKQDYVWLSINAIPQFRDQEEKPYQVFVTLHDLSERKRAEESLRLSHQRFLMVLDSIDAMVYVADMATHEILFMNKNMIEGFGNDLTGSKCWSVFRGQPGQCPWCTNDKLIDGEGRPMGVHTWHDKNPITGRWYVNHDRAIEWTDGRLVRLQIATDITDLKRMEDELRQAQKMEAIGTLAGGIAHDFNNIVGIIIGNTDLALDDIPEWSPARTFLEEIMTASLRAKDVIQQLLSFSRKTEQDKKILDIGPVIRESVQLLRASIPKTVDISLHIADNQGSILANPTQIQQIIINLCTNAAQAMQPEGGTLEIGLCPVTLGQQSWGVDNTTVDGSYIELKVSDTGKGISPDNLKRIFDPYFTTKQVGEGSGMGLTIVHGIVKNHEGALSVASQPNKGTTFTIVFPVRQSAAAETIPVQTTHSDPRGNEHILVVDDEKAIAAMMQKMLERLGYQVKSCFDPLEALNLFKEQPERFDLVITDMTMPQMTGIVLTEQLKALRPDLPVIIVTGYNPDLNNKQAKDLMADGCVMKPVGKKAIARLIRDLLDQNG